MKKRARSASRIIDIEESISNLPKEVNEYVEKSMALAAYISNFKNSNEYKQKDIAAKIGKNESEISKWMSGMHNLTLGSVLKLESACSIKILNPAIFSKSQGVASFSIKGLRNFVPAPLGGSQKEIDAYFDNDSGILYSDYNIPTTSQKTLEAH